MAIGLALNVSAQFGVHAGVVGTGIHSSEFGIDPDFKTGMGFKVGVGYTKNFGPLGVGFELNYENRQTREVSSTPYDYNDDGEIVGVIDVNEDPYGVQMISPAYIPTMSYNYISLPILAHFYLGPVNIHVGAQASYLLGGYEHKLDYKIDEFEQYDGSFPNGQMDFEYSDTEGDYTYRPFYNDGYANGTWNEDGYFEPVEDEFFKFEDLDIAAVIGLEIGSSRGLYGSARLTYSITPIMNMAYVNDRNEWATNVSAYSYDEDGETYYEINEEDYFTEKDIARLDKFITTSFAIGYRF